MKIFEVHEALLGDNWVGGELEMFIFSVYLNRELARVAHPTVAVVQGHCQRSEEKTNEVHSEAWNNALGTIPAALWLGGQPHWTDLLWYLGACREGLLWAREFESFPEAWEACADVTWLRWLLSNLGVHAMCTTVTGIKRIWNTKAAQTLYTIRMINREKNSRGIK